MANLNSTDVSAMNRITNQCLKLTVLILQRVFFVIVDVLKLDFIVVIR